MGQATAAAVGAVSYFGEQSGEYDQHNDGGQTAIQVHVGDDVAQSFAGAGAVEQLAHGHAGSEQEHHAPHHAVLCFFPSEQGAGLAILLHNNEEADEAQSQHGVCRCQAGEQACVPSAGKGQQQCQDEGTQAELFNALHGAQLRIAVFEEFLGSFQSLDFSAHGQHTHTNVDARVPMTV